MFKTKVSPEVTGQFKQLAETQAELMDMLSLLAKKRKALWHEIKNEFSEYNIENASINNETGELILPFQKEIAPQSEEAVENSKQQANGASASSAPPAVVNYRYSTAGGCE